MDQPITVRHITIPASELEWRFDTGGGPGGQHANRNATRVELAWDLDASPSIDEATRQRLRSRLGGKVRAGRIVVVSSASRSQWANRKDARLRLAEMLDEALRPRRRRVATKPSRAARRARLERKRRRSETKRLRRRPEID